MRFQMSISKEMSKALGEEQNERMLSSLQETMRSIIADYFMIKRMQDRSEIIKKPIKRKKKEEKIVIKPNPLIV